MSVRDLKHVTVADLARLPRRGIVAFAARCARRARPCYEGAAGGALDEAIAVAEAFAGGADQAPGLVACVVTNAERAAEQTYAPPSQFAASAALHAARAASLAARIAPGPTVQDPRNPALVARASEFRDVATCAHQAAMASHAANVPCDPLAMSGASTRLTSAERADCEVPLSPRFGRSLDVGQAVDLAEGGPLGPLSPPGST
jgi:hypothetical protein